MYSLPTEYWKEEILTNIGNTLGNFIKVSEKTRHRWYTTYSRICIYLDISHDILDRIALSWDEEDWFQAIDDEKIHFRCKRCHEHGHVFRDCPQNKITRGKKYQENQYSEGFTRVPNKKILAKKKLGPDIHKKFQTQNRF